MSHDAPSILHLTPKMRAAYDLIARAGEIGATKEELRTISKANFLPRLIAMNLVKLASMGPPPRYRSSTA